MYAGVTSREATFVNLIYRRKTMKQRQKKALSTLIRQLLKVIAEAVVAALINKMMNG
jgi:hypothetical protein